MPTRTRGAGMDRGDSQPTTKKPKLSEPAPAAAPKLSPADANNNKRSPRKRLNASNLNRSTTMKFARLTIEPRNKLGVGKAFTFGINDIGQLGIRPLNALKRKFPALVDDLQSQDVKEVAGGSLHTVVLTTDGKVYTFGNNDDNALGREAEEEDDMKIPGIVDIPYSVIMISSGDSHVAVLTEAGQVFAWGGFRDANGFFGLIADDPRQTIDKPLRIYPHPENHIKIVKIASGANHLVLLSEDGVVYTCGENACGQLGREYISRATRSCPTVDNPEAVKIITFKLKPMEVKFAKKIVDIWAGGNMTFFKTVLGVIWACGLNSTNQLGLENKSNSTPEEQLFKVPKRVKAFDGHDWRQFAMGEHHTIALNSEGKVFAVGKNMEGQLGLGANLPFCISVPTKIPTLDNFRCAQIGCGGTTSYAITDDCKLYAWGFGENWQLGYGEDEDRKIPTLCVSARDSPGINGRVTFVSGGTQHTVIIIAPSETN